MTISKKEIEVFWDEHVGIIAPKRIMYFLKVVGFGLILDLFLKDFEKKNFENFLDILFIGPRKEEVEHVKEFLKEKGIDRDHCFFTGVDIYGLLTAEGLNHAYNGSMRGLGGENNADASAINNFKLWLSRTFKEKDYGFDLIVIRRIDPDKSIVQVIRNSVQNLSKNGRVIVTSQEEHKQIKAICKEAAKAPFVDVKYAGNSGLEKYEYPLENYVFVAGKK